MSTVTPAAVQEAVERAFREDQGRAVGSLVRAFGDIQLAEESVQDAYALALRKWGARLPDNPGAWIVTTARNRAIDRLRRAGRLEEKTAEMAVELDRRQQAADDSPFASTIVDDRLRLIFTCCHPSLAPEAQVALTLRLVAGLTTAQIARAFLVQEATMAARLTRAKKKIRAAKIPFRVPPDHELHDRLAEVLGTVYLVFNEGYLRSEGEVLVDAELCGEAIRLGRLLRRLMPTEPEVAGLLALMLLTDARRAARTRGRRLVLLAEQDRSRWDHEAIEEGAALVEAALRRGRPGSYQLQAAIQAVHCQATTFDATDWVQIAGLYAALEVMDPSPVVRLNRAVAVGMVEGAAAMLALADSVAAPLARYHLLHAVRADALAELGRVGEARDAYQRALALADNAAEQRVMEDKLRELG